MDGWPLVGRDKELTQVAGAVADRRGAVIIGPAGVGKTTLALRCLELARKRGMAVARASATRASQALPFGALAPVLPPDPDGDYLGRENRTELLRRYGRAVAETAGGRPLVVFVNDAHLLDGGSATLVHQLALTGKATVLLTVQSGQTVPDPVVALWKDALAERVEVAVLPDAAIEELLVTVLGGPVDTASLRQLANHCRGNPMVLRELVTGALDSGALAADGGIWRLRSELRPTARLVELVALRLGNLTDAERAVLELVAVGEPLGQAELARLADGGSVETLERKGLITSLADGRRVQLRLAHPVVGDVVRAGLSALRERALTRPLAEVIETTGVRRREDTLRLASLRLTGGGGSASLLQAGAIAARSRHDHSLAEQLARAALAEGAGFGARFVAAEAAQFQGRPAQAERELAALAADAASDAERARVALLRFDNAFFLQGRVPDLRLLDDVAGAVADPFWRDQLLDRHSFVMSFSRGPRAVVETASTSLRHPGSEPLTAAHMILMYNLSRLGRLDEVTRLLSADPASASTPAPDQPWVLWALFSGRVATLIWAGRLREAEQLLTHAQGMVIDQPAAEASAFVAHRLASLHLEQGRPVSAFRRASESYTLFQQLGRAFAAQLPYAEAAQALALAGQPAGPPGRSLLSTPSAFRPC